MMVVENFVLMLTAALLRGSAHAYMTSNDLGFKIYEDHFGKLRYKYGVECRVLAFGPQNWHKIALE